MEIADKALELYKSGESTVKAILEDGSKKNIKLFISNTGHICRKAKGYRRRGYMLRLCDDIIDIQPIRRTKTPEQRWRDSWLKVRSRIEKSGLWSEILKDLDTALEVGYFNLRKASDIYWSEPSDIEQVKLIKEISPKLIITGFGGKEIINTHIIWDFNNVAEVKKMWFGKYITERILHEIAEAIEAREPYIISTGAGYDVSFQYKPETNHAWYSEQYRGCGNGHYYLAIDSTHAAFKEDD